MDTLFVESGFNAETLEKTWEHFGLSKEVTEAEEDQYQ